MNLRALIFGTTILLLLGQSPAFSQLRRPGFVTVEREDRTKSRLNREEGAIYLDGMVTNEVKVRIDKTAPAYSNLTGDRWLGNLFDKQNAVLLAVSDRAYRVRGKAKQGQIAGWVSKAAVSGLPADFEKKLKEFHERYVIVEKLIENKQVALGMTVEEVIASIGPPDKRSSKITQTGRTDTLEFISYERVPQTTVVYDSFGRAFPSTQYVEVESGRVVIEFANDAVSSISESEGLEMGEAGGYRIVPPPIFLF
ncbi:MAG: hypothetical protein P1U85_20445 [Verrucomicrobiales bacterium]|nr:hypothetical protein [Verrucomicrobiales bacterium]